MRFANKAGVIEEILGYQILSKQCFVTINGSRAAKGFIQMVEELESIELFADVDKVAEHKAVEDLLEGLDIVGPLPTTLGNRKFFIAATNYFTNWVETEALASIKEKVVKKIFWQNIITRFRILMALISNNDTQFDGRIFRGFCEEHKIEFYNSTPAYPHANGQAEASNKVVLDGLKNRLEKAKGKWAEELPHDLWAY
ncbi:uncharacterized protein K02A2.6-like [Camellia sinensis]|uniref:uncharacterized protein K02A2.6-like n=1 Tax=Camellia sinensis TaxID=4442 RepID=UPI001036CB39|nr:uncharacterized protein K02A2.6-like [Camellia sinensis]